MDYQDIPTELKSAEQWGLFKKVWNEDTERYTKIPISALTGRKASSTDERTWTDFNEALLNMDMFGADGLAFFFKAPFFGIDMDHYADEIKRHKDGDYEVNPITAVLESTKSYAEISVSGEGMHVIAKGSIPGDKSRHKQEDGKVVEMYDHGRFFALTGNTFGEHASEVAEVDKEVLNHLYQHFIQPDKNETGTVTNIHVESNDLTKEEVISAALASANGAVFKKLYDGEWEGDYASHSEADIAFANMLAFWTAHDRFMMDDIFRDSGLYRDKWDEKHGATTYGEGTINRAITDGMDVYSPSGNSDNFEVFIKDYDFKAKEQSYPVHDYSDEGIAKRFYDRWGDIVLYAGKKQKGHFMVFDGIAWKEDNYGFVDKRMLEIGQIVLDDEEPIVPPEPDLSTFTDVKEYNAAFKEWSKQKNAAERAYRAFVKRIRSSDGLNSAERILASYVQVSMSDFDKETGVINTPDGIYDLATGERFDNSPERMFTKVTAVAPDLANEPKEFKKFLNQVMLEDEELTDYLMKWIGYSMFGTGEEEQYLILLGSGRNGKGVLMGAVKNALGDYVTAVEPSTFTEDKHGGNSGSDAETARLRGARLVSVSEFPQNQTLDAAKMKKLTGGGTFVANPKFETPFEFTSYGVPIMDTNYLPTIKDSSVGIWERTNVIPFRLFVSEQDRDTSLKRKLARESGAILWLLIKAAMKWRQEGLSNRPDVVKTMNKQYRTDNDPIGEFIEEYFIVAGPDDDANDFFVSTKEITTAYMDWTPDTTGKPSRAAVGKEFKKRFHKRDSSGKWNGYNGVQLRVEQHGFSVGGLSSRIG
ncbi:hypothetical protein EFL81_09960 [Weissella confusa]|uniref:phage/plasmid primase, P4 family n=1 Tax=Weissella confusa TaxID=1583 RepID=UPI0021B01995|nr:phage/plasmid primase, P4 family [Weissella confusa]MCS9997135.1 hypothetical protein [Weissella confusa]